MTEHFGFLSLIPTAIVLIVAIITRRTIAAVICGVIAAFILIDGINFLPSISTAVLNVMQAEDTGWVLLVCGLYGSFIALLVRAGGAQAFGNMVTKRVTTKQGSLLWTWLLGLVIFLDDYLNSLTVSSSMKKVTDSHRTSREMLSYVVDSTAAPICLIIPISTWAVYFASLLESNGVAADGEGINIFIQSIPYMFYPFVAVIMVPLVITGVIPLIGKMKLAEERAESTGQVIPPGSEHIELDDPYEAGDNESPSISLFFVPILVLIGFTIWFDIDLLIGVIAGILITFIQYWLMGVLKPSEMCDSVMAGLKTMLPVLTILISVFTLIEANNSLGFTAFIIETVSPLMSAKMLPIVTFITMAFISFTTGSNWGVFGLAIPVVFPLAEALDVNIYLMAGALFSASGFGSQACFYSDSTVLTAQGAGCSSYDHAITQLPYALIAAGISAIGFLIVS
ncbi:Na+/H+ antiporter NhaC family protein [uncultured Umboniibacter sp.]|uniref:Na+/H+ antiporter NhaC family protein n=1 Tax=uncultured Umboniibacter sp. TaxID=1798917 RepID=UPI00262E0472|nr:Na+/H+ antiporter NhaC family protein [uncultured Umboniibacter sp.]